MNTLSDATFKCPRCSFFFFFSFILELVFVLSMLFRCVYCALAKSHNQNC